MKEVKIKVYKFEELPKRIQDVIINREREFIYTHDLSMYLDEEIDYQLQEATDGPYPHEYAYDTSCSQGSGTVIYGKLDREFIKKRMTSKIGIDPDLVEDILDNTTIEIVWSGRYPNTGNLSLEYDFRVENLGLTNNKATHSSQKEVILEAKMRKVAESCFEDVVNKSHELHKQLLKMDEAVTSDETITANLVERGDYYTENGAFFGSSDEVEND